MRTVHVVPVGLSLWDNIGPDSADTYAGGDKLCQFLAAGFDDRYDLEEVDFDPVETLTATYPLFRGERPTEVPAALVEDFGALSAETTSLHGEGVVAGRLSEGDHVLLIASHTRPGLRTAVGVAHAIDIAAHHHAATHAGWGALAHHGWRVTAALAGTDPDTATPALLDRLTLPGGTVLVLDHLDMLSVNSYERSRAALGRVAAVWTVLLATELGTGLRLHINGGFKALMPPLLSTGSLVAALVDARRTHHVDAVLVPRGDGFAAAQESMTTPLDSAFGLGGLRESLRADDPERTREVIQKLRPLPIEFASLLDTLLTENGNHTKLGSTLLRPPVPSQPTAHVTGL
ncbi:hypothetical protein AB0L41_39435 [Amycolatopsis mediterranei]|uniref:hypothetical protein n=1 Tax=Amycolatopsis mediterranei TaxID=33910 RepID=UPI00342947FE